MRNPMLCEHKNGACSAEAMGAPMFESQHDGEELLMTYSVLALGRWE
jgi:hypothetical protein